MRSLVAIAVAAPWVVWALVRTLGLEVPYPFVALLAFTPYAALSSPLPVVVGAAAAAVGGRGRGGGGAAWRSGVALRAAGGRAGREPDAQGPRLVVMTSNLWLGRRTRGRCCGSRASTTSTC